MPLIRTVAAWIQPASAAGVAPRLGYQDLSPCEIDHQLQNVGFNGSSRQYVRGKPCHRAPSQRNGLLSNLLRDQVIHSGANFDWHSQQLFQVLFQTDQVPKTPTPFEVGQQIHV